jgi:hypothetical protein
VIPNGNGKPGHRPDRGKGKPLDGYCRFFRKLLRGDSDAELLRVALKGGSEMGRRTRNS